MNKITSSPAGYILAATIILILLVPGCHEKPGNTNPLDKVTWDPPVWSPEPAGTSLQNLTGLLSYLEQAAARFPELWFLESHFSSVKMLVKAYPPPDSLADELIAAFRDTARAGGIRQYLAGNHQLLLAYSSTGTGEVSYVVYTLPENWNPGLEYPLFCWGRGGGDTPYPGDIHSQLSGQVEGGYIPGTPSGVYKDGYTVIPGALGERSYAGDCLDDFFQGLNAFLGMYKTDPHRFYLAGFSNGGKATYLVASQTVDTYHWAAFGMCAPAIRDSQFVAKRVENIADVPIWLGGGVNDSTWIIPTRKLNSLLTGIGKPPESYIEAEGTGHEWTWEFMDSMYSFFLTKEYIEVSGSGKPE